MYSITGITQISDDTIEEEWDEEDLLPLLPMGTNFQNFVNFDNIATERDTGTDGDWEKDFLQETRNIHESGITTDNDIDDMMKVTLKLTMNYMYLYTHSLIHGIAVQKNGIWTTNNKELVDIMTKAQEVLKKEKRKAVHLRNQTNIESFFSGSA